MRPQAIWALFIALLTSPAFAIAARVVEKTDKPITSPTLKCRTTSCCFRDTLISPLPRRAGECGLRSNSCKYEERNAIGVGDGGQMPYVTPRFRILSSERPVHYRRREFS